MYFLSSAYIAQPIHSDVSRNRPTLTHTGAERRSLGWSHAHLPLYGDGIA